MSFDSIWPGLALIAAALGLIALPAFRFLDAAPDARTHHASIDGLRGLLALIVFVFHLVVTRRFIETGVWQVPDSRFYALLGPVGVSLFFMITGFLFWRKLLQAHGRPRWKELYVGRLLRIGPMYLVVVLLMLAIVFMRTGWQLVEPAGAVGSSVVQWLALGMLDGQPDVNGVKATHILAGVTWTIFYEWLFYASLAAMALFASGRRHLLFVAVALALCIAGKGLLQNHVLGIAALFFYGMAAASLLHEGIAPRASTRILSAIAVACVMAIFATSRGGYGSFVGAALGLLFYLVCSGASLFGLLASRPARRLGAISYSLYLMQGLALTVCFAITPLRDAALASASGYWAAGIACMVLLVVASSITYRFIEAPGIALGRRLLRRSAAATGYRTKNQVGENAVKPGL